MFLYKFLLFPFIVPSCIFFAFPSFSFFPMFVISWVCFFSSVNPTCRFQISTFSAYFLFCAPTSKFFWGGFPHNVQIRPGTRLNPLFVIPTCRFQISTFSAYFLSCAHTSKFSSFFFPKCSDPPGNSRGPRPGLGLQEAGQRRGLPRNHHIRPQSRLRGQQGYSDLGLGTRTALQSRAWWEIRSTGVWFCSSW